MKQTRTHSVTMAKADQEDLQVTLDLLNACELALETPRYSMQSAEDNWQGLDDDDPDKQLILKIKKALTDSEGGEIDDRILMYEFLKRKFYRASCSWRRVYLAADLLIDNCCDPTEDHLAFYPGYTLNHVEPEQ